MSDTTTPLTALCRFEMGGRAYHPGDALAVSESAAQRLVALGLARAEAAPTDAPLPLADAMSALADAEPRERKRKVRRGMSVCATPGCPELVQGGVCRGCRAKSNAARRTGKRAYGTAEWRRTRADFLAAHPYCMCDAHAALPLIIRPLATEVDHIDGLGPLGPRGHDWSNLQAMTKPCHSRKTASEHLR